MSIVNTIQRLMNGYGNGTCYVTAAAIALSAGPQTQTVTLANSGFTQGYSNGLIRVKVYNGGGANTTCVIAVNVQDGTNTVYVFPTTAAIPVPNTALGGLDFLVDVQVDIAITIVAIVTTIGGTTTTASLDYEIDLNP
jgi:hypothetical protein